MYRPTNQERHTDIVLSDINKMDDEFAVRCAYSREVRLVHSC
jgi:hypothetical protein